MTDGPGHHAAIEPTARLGLTAPFGSVTAPRQVSNDASTSRRNTPRPMSRILRPYALAVGCVAISLAASLILQASTRFATPFPSIYLFAVALTAWNGGPGPALLSIVLSVLCLDYFFMPPLYSLQITLDEVPVVIVFLLFGGLITRFSDVRRRIERDLRHARDQLQAEVVVRTEQASLLDLTHDTIFVRDMNDVITYWNHGAHELYGLSPEEATGQRAHELLRTTFPVAVEDIREELLGTGRWEGELTNTTASGTRVVVASRWSLRRDQHGHPVAVMETNNDITERRRWEDDIRGLNQELGRRSMELEATNKELEAFAYSVSHDLRAPLRHMAGYAELLHKTVGAALDAKGQRFMAMILESAKRMGDLIDDLLAFSRIGRAETRWTHVEMNQLVADVVAELRRETAGRDIVWDVGSVPACDGDRSMLRLVLLNLLSNAVKFTRGRSRAVIEIGCLSDSDGQVVVFVRDNGAGFDMRYVHKLFGVFQRLHRSDAFEGTGIGLATVQRIIHRHGGTVRGEGVVDQGATFTFSLPKRVRLQGGT
jgi:PAS domain S-box-containing protein